MVNGLNGYNVLFVLIMLVLVKKLRESYEFDELSIFTIVMGTILVDCRWLKIKEMESYKWNVWYWRYGKSIWCYSVFLCTFLGDHLLCFGHDLKYNSMYMSTCVSTYIGKFLVVDWMYRSSYVLLIW